MGDDRSWSFHPAFCARLGRALANGGYAGVSCISLMVLSNAFIARSIAAQMASFAGAERSSVDTSGILAFDALSSTMIPSSLEVAGGTIADDGTLALVAPSQGLVLLVRSGHIDSVCVGLSRQPVAVSFDDASHRLYVFDRVGPSILSVDEKGVCALAQTVATSDSIIAGVHALGSWFIAAESEGDAGIFRSVGATRTGREIQREVTESSWYVSARSHFEGASDHLTVSALRFPFEWVRFSSKLGRIVRSSGFRTDTQFVVGTDSADASALAALGTFALDSMNLQVLADLRSTIRVWVLYDQDGRRIRAMATSAPMGVIAVDAQRSEMLVLRRTDVVEAVVFRWHWRS